MPVYYPGFYVSVALVPVYLFTKDIFWMQLGIIAYLLSYIVTVYAQFRKKIHFQRISDGMCAFSFLPYLRLYWPVVGFVIHRNIIKLDKK